MRTQRLTKLQLHVMTFCSTHGLRGFQFAALVGISPSRLSEYQLGRRPIPYHHLTTLCELFQCGPKEVMGWTDDQDIIDLDPDAEYQDI